MRPLLKAISLSAVALGIALSSAPASADTFTYNYTGVNYNYAVSPYTTSMNLTATFSVASALPASSFFAIEVNGEFVSGGMAVPPTATPTSWQFEDGVNQADESNLQNSFLVEGDTDATGRITDWSSVFVSGDLSTNNYVYVLSCGGSFLAQCTHYPDEIYGFVLVDGVYDSIDQASTATQGSWPEVSPVPEPSGLMEIGILALALGRYIRRVRSRDPLRT